MSRLLLAAAAVYLPFLCFAVAGVVFQNIVVIDYKVSIKKRHVFNVR